MNNSISKIKIGLTENEAMERLKKFGKNIFWKKKGFDWKRFLKEEVISLFNIILLIVFFVSFLGGGQKIESLLILFFLFISIVLSLFSELNFHRLYLKLEKFLQKKVLVLRDNKTKYIFSEFLVPGDIIYLTKGEKVPADCQVLNCFNFLIDEQILTGESIPIEKKEKDIIFAGTEILEGEVQAEVKFTGSQTKFSQIGKLAIQTPKKSAYQKELETFTRSLIKVVMVFFSFLFLFHILFKTLETKDVLMFSLILGISVIPEFFPPITVLTLSIFSNLFAKKENIVKRLTAIEDLGVIDVLCVDKTGTLTTNDLKLEKIDSSEPKNFLLFALSLSSGISQQYLSDFRKALEEKINEEIKEKIKNLSLINRKLFDPLLRISQGIIDFNGKRFLVIIGAPESVLEISSFQKEEEREYWFEKLKEYSENGFRVYSMAIKEIKQERFIKKGKKIFGFNFLGLAIFRDSIKKTAKESLLIAEKLGVDVKILTGDRPEVAKKVALEIGLIKENEKVFSENELLNLSDKEFQMVIEKYNVFARVTPEMKYKIVKALEKKHQLGYLGEGINDLPVIKLAQVGLVVDTAQDAAKEVADVILLKKDLRVIVEGMILGRKAFFNIIKFLRHTMSDNFGNFFSVGILSLFLPFLPLTPIQIIASDFLTDFPLFAVSSDYVLEKETKKPAHYRTKELFLLLIMLGTIAAFFNFLAFLIFKNNSADFVRTIIFLQTTLSGIIVFYSIRTNEWFFKSKPSFLMHFSIIVALVLTFSFLFPPFRQWFGFVAIPFKILIFLLFLNLIFLLVNDLVKKITLKIVSK